jgi:hypothetical protein
LKQSLARGIKQGTIIIFIKEREKITFDLVNDIIFFKNYKKIIINRSNQLTILIKGFEK